MRVEAPGRRCAWAARRNKGEARPAEGPQGRRAADREAGGGHRVTAAAVAMATAQPGY